MLKLLSLDVDGTLLNPEDGPYSIPQQTVATLKKIQAQNPGLKVILNSGREPWLLDPIARLLNISSYGAFSGRYAWADGEPWQDPGSEISPALLKTIFSLVQARKFHHAEVKSASTCFVFSRLDFDRTLLGAYKIEGWFEPSCFTFVDSAKNIPSIFRLELAISSDSPLFAALEATTQEAEDEFSNDLVHHYFPELESPSHIWLRNPRGRRKGLWYLRLIKDPEQFNKASVLKHLMKKWSIAPTEIVHVGDSSRVIDGDSVVKAIGASYFAMGNGDAGARAQGDKVLPDVSSDPLNHVIPRP